MKSLAQPEGFVNKWLSRVGDFFCLSIVWLVCCLPLITIVPACVALYDAVANCVHGKEDHACKWFFSALRREIVRGILLTLLWLAIAAVLVGGYWIAGVLGKGTAGTVFAMVYAGTLLLPLATLAWVIPIQSRYAYGFWELHRTALSFVVIHLPATAGILAITLVTAAVVAFFPVLAVLLPAIGVTVQCGMIEKVFGKYAADEETEDCEGGESDAS